MLFIQVCLSHYQFDNFTTYVEYKLPLANFTQYFMVTQDQQQQYIHYYNKSGVIIDSTYSKEESYHLTFEKSAFVCYQQEPSREIIFPNLSQFNYSGSIFKDNRRVEHFRFESYYSLDENSTPILPNILTGFLYNQSYQQDFFCFKQNDNCVPYMWEIHGRSNFGSHQDYYVLTYLNYSNLSNNSYFKIQTGCENPSQKDGQTKHLIVDHILKQLSTIAFLQSQTQGHYQLRPNRFIYEDQKKMFGKSRSKVEPNIEQCWNEVDNVSFPISLDWRLKGISTPVKDQVSCGSCWAFATIGAVEARVNIKEQKLNPQQPLHQFSEQMVVDCFWDRRESIDPFLWSHGCTGGQPDYALIWIMENKILFEQVDYPYLGLNDYCKMDEITNSFEVNIQKVCRVPTNGSEEERIQQLKYALLSGPVAVTVDVPESFTFYSGGIYDDKNCIAQFEQLDHNVLLLGWGVDNEVGEYWIIKNSWSNYWGMDGYIYIKIEGNICGILTDAAYPII